MQATWFGHGLTRSGGWLSWICQKDNSTPSRRALQEVYEQHCDDTRAYGRVIGLMPSGRLRMVTRGLAERCVSESRLHPVN